MLALQAHSYYVLNTKLILYEKFIKTGADEARLRSMNLEELLVYVYVRTENNTFQMIGSLRNKHESEKS